MCALCGLPSHVAEPTPKAPPRARFAAFQNPDCRDYIVGASLSMGGDSIEHVISYWVLFQQFHSPALAGFAVISHWVPSLFGVYFGALADRYDCRKIIQAAQLLFMSVSAIWGVLFLTNSLQMWHALILLSMHVAQISVLSIATRGDGFSSRVLSSRIPPNTAPAALAATSIP